MHNNITHYSLLPTCLTVNNILLCSPRHVYLDLHPRKTLTVDRAGRAGEARQALTLAQGATKALVTLHAAGTRGNKTEYQ